MKPGTLAVLALAAFLAAATPDARAQHAMYFHMGIGRFLQAETAAEERLKTEEATARILAPLCTIYYRLRR